MSKKRGWSGEELLSSNFPEPFCLIDNLIWEGDNIIVLGDAKTGKSLFSLQLLCSLTSGEPLFDTYKVQKVCNILYVQAEGKISESGSRYKRMTRDIRSEPTRVRWLHVPHIPMDREESAKDFVKLVNEEFPGFIPHIIFFDPLYMMASTGSLKDDDVATRITANLNHVKDIYSCTLIINHHEHRPKTDPKNFTTLEEGDNSIFGSFVWRAWPDHILRWKKTNKHGRILSCNTQRSGSVVEDIRLFFNEPDPLFFEIQEDTTQSEHVIYRYLVKTKSGGVQDFRELTGLADSTIYKALRKLTKQGKIFKCEKGVYYANGQNTSEGTQRSGDNKETSKETVSSKETGILQETQPETKEGK